MLSFAYFLYMYLFYILLYNLHFILNLGFKEIVVDIDY